MALPNTGLRKITLNVQGSDWDALEVLYPAIGRSLALRNILNQHVKQQMKGRPTDLRISLDADQVEQALGE